MCSFQVNFASMITPRNFVLYTRSITVPSICRAILPGICLLPKIMKLVLVTFSESLFARNHVASLESSPFTIRCKLVI